MANIKMHNVKFYNLEPLGITCMALNKPSSYLALCRCDNSVEIWNLKDTCYLERKIVPTIDNASVEGLAWCKDRLFSVGLDGFLTEYNLLELRVKNVLAVTGGPAYCLDTNQKQDQIAVGTEQGYINIFDIGEEVVFKQLSDRQEGSILCLKYNFTGEFIVTGSTDAIRIWNVNTGQAISKLVGRAEGQSDKETVVWCLAVLKDFTIISGDSRGRLTFWDGNIPAQIESFQSLKSGVLSICVSDDENCLFCAGVDPTITQYVKVDVKGGKKWVKSVERKVSDHDVKAMVQHGIKTYTGGVDGYLDCTFHPPKTVIRHPCILKNPCVCIASKRRLILLRYPKHLEVWFPGHTEGTKKMKLGFLPCLLKPRKLMIIQKPVESDKNSEKDNIIYSTISGDAKYIAYSHTSGVRLFYADFEDLMTPKLYKVDSFNYTDPASLLIFSEDSTLLVIGFGKTIKAYTLSADEIKETQNLSINVEEFSCPISFLVLSSDNKYMIAGDSASNIIVWTLKNKKWNKYCRLPRSKSGLTALALNSKTLTVVAAYADNTFIEYDLKEKGFSPFYKKLLNNFPQTFLERNFPVRNILFDRNNDNLIILHDDNNIIVVDKTKSFPTHKKIKSEISGNDSQNISFKFRYVTKYKHLIYLGWLSEKDSEMVSVEIPPLNFKKQLPPCFVQNTFGKK